MNPALKNGNTLILKGKKTLNNAYEKYTPFSNY